MHHSSNITKSVKPYSQGCIWGTNTKCNNTTFLYLNHNFLAHEDTRNGGAKGSVCHSEPCFLVHRTSFSCLRQCAGKCQPGCVYDTVITGNAAWNSLPQQYFLSVVLNESTFCLCLATSQASLPGASAGCGIGALILCLLPFQQY